MTAKVSLSGCSLTLSIPECLVHFAARVHKSDFVMSLKGGVSQAADTLSSYVVTSQLAERFDAALSVGRTSTMSPTSTPTRLS